MSIFKDEIGVLREQPVFEVVEEDDGLSAVNLSRVTYKNKRVATRYVRDDILIALCEVTQFSFGKEIFIDFVKLNDITGRGLSFSSVQQLTIHKKVIINLIFIAGKTFKIHANIVYRTGTSTLYHYGVKFDNDNHNLSDHLLETQRNLVFK